MISVTLALLLLASIGFVFMTILDKVEHEERLRRYRERELNKYF